MKIHQPKVKTHQQLKPTMHQSRKLEETTPVVTAVVAVVTVVMAVAAVVNEPICTPVITEMQNNEKTIFTCM